MSNLERTAAFEGVRVGDQVTRNLAGCLMTLKVTSITRDRIECGPWLFDRATGAEIDEQLQWGPAYGRTGSYLVPN